MPVENMNFKAIVSSDWSECLSPSGPFDFMWFVYPELEAELRGIFKQYTGNVISLGTASQKIQQMLPASITEEEMDAYLDNAFMTYKGVPDLIDWCLSQNILFMINTTGMIGYFQRVFARGWLPKVPVLSANPMVRYHRLDSDPNSIYDLFETRDKAKNTGMVARQYEIPADKIILMGDSGGDGPHFEWGSENGTYLIGSMTKYSLESYCQSRGIQIDLHFGPSYVEGAKKDPQKEMRVDFMELSLRIAELLNP
jgi:2-hydroxy-3-keto-5-methylthiopentenyl-1-phosphate phosphatase